MKSDMKHYMFSELVLLIFTFCCCTQNIKTFLKPLIQLGDTENLAENLEKKAYHDEQQGTRTTASSFVVSGSTSRNTT